MARGTSKTTTPVDFFVEETTIHMEPKINPFDCHGLDDEPNTEEAATEPATTPDSDNTGEADRPRVRKIEGPAAEPIDVAGLAGPAVLKRFLPVAVGIIVVILLIRARR